MRHAIATILATSLGAALLVASSCAAGRAEPRTVDRIADLMPALTACWQPPEGSGGSEITLRLALTRHGELRGPPRVTYRKLFGDPARQSSFVAAAAEAIVACTPVRLSETFGRIVSQQVIILRLRGDGRGQDRAI